MKLKRFTKRHLYVLAGLTLVLTLVFCFMGTHYFQLIQNQQETGELKNEIADLRSTIEEREEQIAEFTSKIDSLQLKLVKLNRYEQKLRRVVGKATGGVKLDAYGMGGIISEDVAADFLSSEEYHKMIDGIDQSVQSLDEAAEEQENQFQALWKTLNALKHLEAATPCIRPISGGWISSQFGYRVSPFSGKREFHSGVDIACRKGTPIVATADGKVKFAGVKGLMGKTVEIDHGFGIMTRYGHLDKIRVDCEQHVARGDVIGEMGSSGRSTGPHVHYEVRLNGVPVDGQKYMSRRLAQN